MGRIALWAVRTLVLFVCAVLLAGWSGDWTRVRRDAGAVRTLQAEFVQEKRLPILSRPILSRGRFFYRAPDAIRWEYTAPVPSILVLFGGELRRYLPGKEGLVEERGAETASLANVLKDLTAWFGGDFERNPHFDVTFVKEPRPMVRMTPRGDALARMIQGIEMTLSETPGIFSSVRIVEGPGASTLYRFSQVRVDAPLEDRWFRVAP